MSATKAKILLFLVFTARGTSFLFSKALMRTMTPLGILAVRFLLAFVILAIIYRKNLRNCSKDDLSGGIILGVLYFVCMVFEMYGLERVDTGVSALIENMAIVLVPIYRGIPLRLTNRDGRECPRAGSGHPCGFDLRCVYHGDREGEPTRKSRDDRDASAWRDGCFEPDRFIDHRNVFGSGNR